jgi:GNAT superfamily N-acetyltransferase
VARITDPEPLGSEHVVDGFDCGRASLNAWLVRYARQAAASGSARTYVVVDAEQQRVVGYHALTAAGIEREAATPRVLKGMSRYPVPVVLLARLAVDVTVTEGGLGAWLLRDAMLRALAAADTIGVRALLVHALDDDARAFYLRHGLEPSPTDRLHLMILLKDIAASLEARGDHPELST